MKKRVSLVCFALVVLLVANLFSGLESSSVQASSTVDLNSNSMQVEALEQSVDNIINAISKNVEVNEDGIELEKKKEILINIDQEDVDNFNKLLEAQGTDNGKTLTKQDILGMFEEGIEVVNQKIENGELEVLYNGTLVEAKDDSFYVQGGSTYDKHYWWGVKRYKSTANAKRWIRDLRSTGHANAAGAVLAAAVFGGVGAVPNGLMAVHLYNLADRVEYRNNLNNRGIIANLTYALAFTIKSQ